MPVSVLIDGTDIATQGIYVTGEPDGWLDAPAVNFVVNPLSGRVGGIVARRPDIRERRLMLPIRVVGTSTTTRKVAERWLKGKLTQEVVIRIDDDSADEQLRGIVLAVALRPHARLVSPVSKGSLVILAGDPCWQDISATDLSLSGETTIGLGNAPVRHWSLALDGTFTNATVVIKNGDGDTLHTLTWTGSATAETLTIDSANGIVDLDGTGEFANYTGGFPELDPKDAPTITVTHTSGSSTGTLSLRKRYW